MPIINNSPRNVEEINIGAYEFGACGAVGILDEIYKNIYSYYLAQNFPNPFNPVTRMDYSIPQTNFVTIRVYNVLGKEVATLVNAEKPSGNYEVNFNATNLPSGIYFYRLQAGSFVETKKMVLLK